MALTIILSIVVLVIAITMSMVGKGGGNFYVIAMVLAGVSMRNAATSSQLIMMGTSIAAMLIFHKHNKVDWKLALVIDPPTDIMALIGGYYSGSIPTHNLKLIFAISLIVISVVMLIPVKEKTNVEKHKFGYWNRTFGQYNYTVNLWVTLPITAMVGFFAGAVGISGGAFKIPLMVMLCGIPMEIAIGTSSAMVAVTALFGFAGHFVNGDFDPSIAVPLMLVAIIGGVIGGRYAVKSKPKNLKKIFAITNMAAAIIMLVNLYI
jgi:hypothetical protein